MCVFIGQSLCIYFGMGIVMKQQQFNKDLDKLMSGNYALVPLKPTEDMMVMASVIFNNTPYGTPVCLLIEKLWAGMIAQAINKQSESCDEV